MGQVELTPFFLKKGDIGSGPPPKIRLKRNTAVGLSKKEAIRPKRPCRDENVGAKENEIRVLRAIYTRELSLFARIRLRTTRPSATKTGRKNPAR